MVGRSNQRLFVAIAAGLAACTSRPLELGDSGEDAPVDLDFAQSARSYAVGVSVICATDPEGFAHCWGMEGRSQLEVPDVPLVMLVANHFSVCGLEENGQARCWGGELAGEPAAGEPEPDDHFINVEVGHTVAYGMLPSGQVVQWLSGDGGWAPDIEGKATLRSLDMGFELGCGIDLDSRLRCWVFPDTTLHDLNAVPDVDPSMVSAGIYHACVLDLAGAPHCWGLEDNGGELELPPGNYWDVSAGNKLTCAIDAAGAILCRGLGYDGTPGSGEFDQWGLLDPPKGVFESVRLGASNGCAQRPDGSLRCWGDDEYGQVTAAHAAFDEWWPEHAE